MAVRRPAVLHIATHGFFFPARSVGDPAVRLDGLGSRLSVADSPMLRSGLILAGADYPERLTARGLMDGWATALDLSQLDLRGTELVVLSACNTGRGDYRTGEGVFGLQRAFRFAGAQSLIMSLFQVPDAATQSLMTEFYRRWKPGMKAGSRQKALRQAQLKLLHNPATREPKNWAGFVLMGDR
jgi:CHAT domain-containing protein